MRSAVILSFPVLLVSLVAAAEPHRDLVMGSTQFPSHFHPGIEEQTVKSFMQSMGRRRIVVFNDKWELECRLCTELPTRANGRIVDETTPEGEPGTAVTFTIPDGIAWGDGVPVTSRDAVYALAVGRSPTNGYADTATFTEEIGSIEAKDERTFVIHRKKRVCYPAETENFELLPEHLDRPYFESDPASYRNRNAYDSDPTNPGLYWGPYRLARVDRGALLGYERNPSWRGKRPAFDRVYLRIIENTSALQANLLSGEVDYIPSEPGSFPVAAALSIARRYGDRFDVVFKPSLLDGHIDLRLDNPILADVRVRQALLLALDRETMIKQLFGGKFPIYDSNVNPLDPVASDDFRHYGFDPEAANRLLDAAGWTGPRDGIARTNEKGERLAFELVTTAGDTTRELIQQTAKAAWAKIGIDVALATQPARVLFGDTLSHRKFTGAALYSWASAPHNIPRAIYHSEGIPSASNSWSGENYPGWSDKEVDRTLDALNTTCGEAESRALWRHLQQLYADELPTLPLYQRSDIYIFPKWLKGVVPTGSMDYSSNAVENWYPAP